MSRRSAVTPSLGSNQWRTLGKGRQILAPSAFAGGDVGAYEAARRSRTRAWRPTRTVDESVLVGSWARRTLMSHGRDLFRNNGLVGGAIEDTADHVLGEGILPVPLCDKAAAEDYRAAFLEWAAIADLAGRDSLWDLAWQALVGSEVDGDSFTVLTSTDPGNPLGFPKLQVLRGHRIGSEDQAPVSTTTGQAEDDGVIYDAATGRARAYRLLGGGDDWSADGGKSKGILPADNTLMLARRMFPDQRRGVSAIARGAHKIFDSEEALSAMRTKVKHEAARITVVETPLGAVDQGEFDAELNEGSAPEDLCLESFAEGETLYLAPGEKLVQHIGAAPHETFTGFMEFSYRDFAVGYGTSLEIIWKSHLGGAALRYLLAKTQRRVTTVRSRTFIPRWLQPVYLRWLATMFARRQLTRVPNWWRVGWEITSAALTADAGREARENRADLVQGNRTLQEDAAERGANWRVVRDQREIEADDLLERAARLAEKRGIDISLALNLLQQNNPNGIMPAPAAEPAADPAK